MCNLAIIPARGGSKRIPRKNIRIFHGSPIICHVIGKLVRSGLFDEIVVSTDDLEIAEIAKNAGASVPFLRPQKLADDFTGTREVTQHAANWHSDRGVHFDYACCVYPTAVLLEETCLKEGLSRLAESTASFAFSVVESKFPLERALVAANGFVKPVFPHAIFRRSQDFEKVFYDASQFYWGRTEDFRAGKSVHSSQSIPIVIPNDLCCDIDVESDWMMAEAAFGRLNSLRPSGAPRV